MPDVREPGLNPDVPDVGSAAIDPVTGRFTAAWGGFFRRFSAGAPPLQTIPVGASPLVWTAPGPGDLVLGGGAGLTVQLVRGRAAVAVPGGVVPVARGDVVTAFFTAAPAATFMPRTI